MSVMDKFRIDGKTALITGASHGIGMAMAIALAKAGAKIIFNSRSQSHVEKAIRDYAEQGVHAIGFVCDVTDEEQVNAMMHEISSRGLEIDILVNNAGIIKRIPAVDMSVKEFREVVDIDLTAAFIMTKAVLPGMIERRNGKIINICSLMSELGRETVSAYAAAKGGLKMLTKGIASEYAAYNIQCNGIGPGYIATSQTAPLRADGHPFNAFLLGRTPAGRWGEVDDLTGPIIFLASSASDFVNGQILFVDGGILAYFGKQPK